MKPRLRLLFLLSVLLPALAAGVLGLAVAGPSTTKAQDADRTSPDSGPPFSFTYGGKPSADLLPVWKETEQSETFADRTRTTTTWTDPATGLQVRLVYVTYSDFSAIEWTAWFKNTGAKNLPLLTDIHGLDRSFLTPEGSYGRTTGDFILHTTKGDRCTADSYAPIDQRLLPGVPARFAPVGGRPTNFAFPYFNLQYPGGGWVNEVSGVLLAVGWPGQWAATFTRTDRGVRVTAGQELTRLSLRPGEEIRTPLIAILYWFGDDLAASQNLWRRWMIAHNLPRTADGSLPRPQVLATSSHQFREMTRANEDNQKLFIDRYLEEGLKIDYWWMDAGWYPCRGQWQLTGNWAPDPERFPRGLRAVSDHAHNRGVKTIVWFEPERVGDPKSWIAVNHPEWLLVKPGDWPPKLARYLVSRQDYLLDLGNPAARAWLTDHVDRTITEQGIDLYRQDFNIDPLPFWRAADAPDRQGMTENLYVQGYLAYWDALRQRHPGLRIDSCASGGRRNDLETLRRSVPLIISDYLFEPIGQQSQHYSFAQWVPYYGAGYKAGSSNISAVPSPPNIERYGYRSNLSPSLTLCYDVRDRGLDFNEARRLFDETREVGPEFLGDYWPLTPYSVGLDSWIAWQFNRPETGAGVVQAFRRPASGTDTMNFRLRGLDPAAEYEVKDFDHGASIFTGRELMDRGLTVILTMPGSASMVAYRRK